PGAVVLMPLPDIALECGLGVELELMHVDVLAEQLAQRLDQPRMRGPQGERLLEGGGGDGRARRAGLLPPNLLAIEFEDHFGVVAQKRDFLLAEVVRKEQ